ncbi:MAG: hypothetical protein FWD29_02105 [Micrococcales bacterium]|nr:hypothetical protein [Micrococcales bacterium]
MWRAEADLPGAVVPPLGYSQAWLFGGIGLVLATGVMVLAAFWLTRRRPEPQGAPANQAAASPPADPAWALAQIDSIERAWSVQLLSFRQVHHQLSAVVRACASDQLGLPARQLTLHGLESAGRPQLGQVAVLVRFLYPAQFGLKAASTVPDAVYRARQVVAQWL